tara:strand:- start:486 stop:2102 length:1617 start_codon:yes stop_codon:yes gene_type:complete
VAVKDTSGWLNKGKGLFEATFDYDNGTVGTNGKQNKSKISVITNSRTGNYDVYRKTLFGDKLIYQGNASNDTGYIESANTSDYRDFFTGKNAQQLVNLNRGVKQATLALSRKYATTQQYQELQKKDAYKSLANAEESSDVVELEVIPSSDNEAPLSGGEEQGSGSSAVDNGVFTGGDSTGFLVPDGVPSFSSLTSTDFASLGGDAFLGTVDDALPFEAGFASVLDLDDPYYNPNEGENSKLILKYPEADLTSFGYDYIQIVGHKYKTNAFLTDNIVDGKYVTPKFNDYTSTNGKGIFGKLGRVTGTIHLPMQPNLSESSAVDWNQDEINQLQKIGAGLAAQGITDVRNAVDGKTLMGAFTNLMGNAGSAAQDLLNTPGLGAAITAYFAGQAVGANIVGRSTGQVLNKNLELLFKGPKLRQFGFNFTFTPRSDTEAIVVKNIIRFFKRSMAPQIAPERLFLYTPDIFQLKYIHNSSGDHPFLNKFKPCALTNFSANYTPGNSYMTYKDGSMTQYQVTMTFSELEPIYQHEHKGVGGTGY